jgi:hypothetical protein
MVTLNAHFDGKTIVLDEPFSLPLKSGTRLKISVQPIDETHSDAQSSMKFQPLNIRINPGLSTAIASDPQFNIEES